MRLAHVRRVALASIVLVAMAGCGGGNTVPSGSVVGSSPSPAASGAPVTATSQVTIVIPPATAQSAHKRPSYISPNTQSVSMQLTSVNGQPVSSPTTTLVETYSGAPGCTAGANGMSCTASVPATAGQDLYSVVAFSGPNGTGNTLATGSIVENVTGSGGTLTISSANSISIGGIVANISVSVTPATFYLGTAAKAQIVVNALDASNATIIGPGTFTTPIMLTSSDTTGSVGIVTPSNSVPSTQLSITAPTALTLQYNGSAALALGALTVTATSGSLTSTAQVQISPAPTPSPTPVPSKLIYVLNSAGAGNKGGTVTEYPTTATGNAKPFNTLTLDPTMYPASMTVDASGNLYVGYYTTNGLGYVPASTPSNVVDVYAPGATGSATPICQITQDATTTTYLDPSVLYVNPAGNLITLGPTQDNTQGGYEALLVYVNPSTCPSKPTTAWNYNYTSGLPYINGIGISLPNGGSETGGLYVDTNGNLYLAGNLTTGASAISGVFISDNSYTSAALGPINRQITPSSSTANVQDLAVDPASGNLYVTTVDSSSNAGAISVYGPGTTSSTSNTPLSTLADPALNVPFQTNSEFVAYYATSTQLAYPLLPITISGSQVFVANENSNEILIYSTSGLTNATPATMINGPNTGLLGPTQIIVAPSWSASAAATARRKASTVKVTHR